jgi:peptidoglycan/xylan/chitin deacetylase (PgdA/CDA1 family)
MNRRIFLSLVGAAAHAESPPRLAFSFDDFAWNDIPKLTPDEALDAYLQPLAKRNLKVTLFVCGRHVNGERGVELLTRWGRAGHFIGNHTFSHTSYHNPQMTPAAFADDIERGQAAIETLPGFRKIFRFPQLKEGNTLAKREACREFEPPSQPLISWLSWSEEEARVLSRKFPTNVEKFRAGAGAIGALAVGAVALGALAIGALAIGRLVIGNLRIGKVKIGELEVDTLRVRKLEVTETELP